MKKSFLFLLAGSILTVYSCSDDKAATEQSTTPTQEMTPATDATTQDPMGTTTPAAEIVPGQPGSTTVIPGSTITAGTPAPATSAASGPLNPPHGQPGHRCEIAVGAPLSSAPAEGTVPTAGTAPQPAILPGPGQAPTTQRIEMPATATPSAPAPGSIMTAPATGTTPAPATTTTAPGMNPPHGQPGHDCSIAVGAPLKK